MLDWLNIYILMVLTMWHEKVHDKSPDHTSKHQPTPKSPHFSTVEPTYLFMRILENRLTRTKSIQCPVPSLSCFHLFRHVLFKRFRLYITYVCCMVVALKLHNHSRKHQSTLKLLYVRVHEFVNVSNMEKKVARTHQPESSIADFIKLILASLIASMPGPAL